MQTEKPLSKKDILFIRYAKNGSNPTIKSLKRLYGFFHNIDAKYINLSSIAQYLHDLVFDRNLIKPHYYFVRLTEKYQWGCHRKYFSDYGTTIMGCGADTYVHYIATIVTCLCILSTTSCDELPGYNAGAWWRNKQKLQSKKS